MERRTVTKLDRRWTDYSEQIAQLRAYCRTSSYHRRSNFCFSRQFSWNMQKFGFGDRARQTTLGDRLRDMPESGERNLRKAWWTEFSKSSGSDREHPPGTPLSKPVPSHRKRTQSIHAFSGGSNLWNLQAHENNESALQKQSGNRGWPATARDNNLWFENNRSQHPHEEGKSRWADRYEIVTQDLATGWLQSYPCKTKTSQATIQNLQKDLWTGRRPQSGFLETILQNLSMLVKNYFGKPLYFDTTPIRDQRCCRKSSKKSQIKLHCTRTVRIGWTLVDTCNGMRLLIAQRSGFNSWWQISYDRWFNEHVTGLIVPFWRNSWVWSHNLRQTKRGFIISARRSSQASSWNMHSLYAGGAGRETYS